jgi:hypothetical protein
VQAVIALWDNGVEWLTDCLAFIIAKNRFGSGIPKNDVSTVICRDNRVTDGVGDRTKFRFRNAQSIFSDGAFSDLAM